MSRPLERYTSFKGKYVRLSNPEARIYGEVSEVDTDNGLFILKNSPAFDPAKRKIVTRDNLVVPWIQHTIEEITKAELEYVAKEFAKNGVHFNRYVKIGEHYGKLVDVGLYSYTLQPALVNITGRYRWETERPVVIQKDNNPLIPASEKELDELVKDSSLYHKLTMLERNHRYNALANNEPYSGNEKKIEDLGLGTRATLNLDRQGIRTISDLAQKTEHELLRLPGIGKTTIRQVKQRLEKAGLRLKSSFESLHQ